MDYFGDESGHLRGLLTDDCEVTVLGVVAGDRLSCQRCPKRAVKRINDISEAKWNDMLDKQKRRLFECFAENEQLEFGYSAITKQQLESISKSHLLYQDVNLPPAWDLALAGYAYGEVLYEMGAPSERRVHFSFDRIISKPQSEAVANHVEAFVEPDQVFIEGSRQSPGVQAADCFAGAIAEDIKSDTNWIDYLENSRVYEVTATSIIQLENDLHEYDTGP